MFRGTYPANWKLLSKRTRSLVGDHCIRCGHINDIPTAHVLTVHHFNGDKSDCRWWNMLALCQRCHLHFQGKCNPEIPYFFEHSEWLKPYVAGFYAWKYLGQSISRREAIQRMPELLTLECRSLTFTPQRDKEHEMSPLS